jgi:hypothetical protein
MMNLSTHSFTYGGSYSILLLALIFCLASCDGSPARVSDRTGNLSTSNPDALKAIPVKGTKTGILDEGEVFSTADALLFGDILIIGMAVANPYYFKAYDVEKEEAITNFGLQGIGPKEIPDFTRMSVSSKEQKVLGITVPNYDGKYYEVYLDSLIEDPSYFPSSTLNFEQGAREAFQKISDKRFVALSISDEKRLALLDANGRILGSHFDYPFQEDFSSFPKSLLGMVHQGCIVYNDETQRVGVFTYNSTCWDIYDFSTPDQPNVVSQYHITSPKAVNDSRQISENAYSYSVAFRESNEMGFLDVKSNNRRIFALYSGRSFSEAGDDFLRGKFVIILDWDGNVLDKVELDFETSCIAVDRKGILYSVVETEVANAIYKYDLSSF